MALARHGRGPAATLSALGSQIHPVFMLPPLASSWFGAVLAGELAPAVGTVHALSTFGAVYTAHVKDGYVDFHVRGEDDDHPLTVTGCRAGLVGAAVLVWASLAALWVLVGPGAALVTAPAYCIGYLHAPQLDTNPVGATAGYPLGIAVTIVSGTYVRTGAVEPLAVAYGLVFLVLLIGVKVIDDAQDYEYDRSIDKRTVAVVLGPGRAWRVAYATMAVALVLVVGFVLADLFPAGAVVAAVAFGAVAVLAARADARVATMLLVRGAYVFLAALIVAVHWRPLASLW